MGVKGAPEVRVATHEMWLFICLRPRGSSDEFVAGLVEGEDSEMEEPLIAEAVGVEVGSGGV